MGLGRLQLKLTLFAHFFSACWLTSFVLFEATVCLFGCSFL